MEGTSSRFGVFGERVKGRGQAMNLETYQGGSKFQSAALRLAKWWSATFCRCVMLDPVCK